MKKNNKMRNKISDEKVKEASGGGLFSKDRNREEYLKYGLSIDKGTFTDDYYVVENDKMREVNGKEFDRIYNERKKFTDDARRHGLNMPKW